MSRKLRFTILCGVVSYMAICLLSSHVEAQPAFSPNQGGTNKGRFESIFRKQTTVIVPQNKTSKDDVPNVPQDTDVPGQDDAQAKIAQVVPLPMVEEENAELAEPEAVTDDDTGEEATEDAANDAPDEQPTLANESSEDEPLEDLWPGWLTDYRTACQKGKDEQKLVFVYLYDTNSDSPYRAFEMESLVDEEVQKSLEDFVLVRIPVTAKLLPTEDKGVIQLPGTEDDQKELDETKEDAEEDVTVLAENVTQANDKAVISQTIVRNPQSQTGTRYTAMRPPSEPVDTSKLLAPGRDMGSVKQLVAPAYDLTFPNLEQEIMLIRHPAFYEMLNTPGVAIIDFQHKGTEYYGTIVSVFPFLKKKPYTVEQTRAMLTLPPGTVTQRSVIFAVRIHPEKPKSADGEVSPRLVEEARSASQHQADIRKQGHHNWDRRFQQINAYLPTELWACEVCAESWPGQHLLESAIECVDCWRYSEGHWSAVSAEHPYYGYDMKLGANGIWYGTGVFGKWRHPTLAKAGTLTGGQPQQLPRR
ncbi:MAG: hypothetical protein FWH27_01770 [Planctomycetaceae bacterium]|nr:hypothetical protein [Planctomycetaceae bacterium]